MGNVNIRQFTSMGRKQMVAVYVGERKGERKGRERRDRGREREKERDTSKCVLAKKHKNYRYCTS